MDYYKKLYAFLKPYKYRALLAAGLSVPVGLLDAVIALSLKSFIDSPADMVRLLVGLIAGIAAVQGVLTYVAAYMNDWVSFKIINDLKFVLYEKLIYKEPAYIDSKTSGAVQRAFNNDVEEACGGLLNNLRVFVTRVFSSVSLFCVLFYNSWQLALAAVLVLVLAMLPLYKIRALIQKTLNTAEAQTYKIVTAYNEVYSGFKTVAAYNLQEKQSKKFKNRSAQIFDLKMKITKDTAWISPVMCTVSAAGIGLIITYGSVLVKNGGISGGNFVSFLTALIMLYAPVRGLGGNAKAFQVSAAALERLNNALEEQPLIKDNENAVEMTDFKESIVFKNIDFAYCAGSRPALRNMNFTVKKGETFALAGHSGSGKSTIINLLLRFYEPDSGAVEIDGRDIRNYKLKSLRNNIAVVFQDNFLFEGTIRENIMAGKLDASEEELFLAVKNACLEEFSCGLDEGIDTQIGERGILLSGGQRQRVGIARAFLKNAPILILDEATSALDNRAEASVQEAMDNLMKDRTVIVAAHRLSTIRNADRIAVIENGTLVECGAHSELLSAENGRYRALYDKVEMSC